MVCPAFYNCLENFNLETQRCEDVCSYYFFQKFDSKTSTCVVDFSATLVMCITGAVLVLAEIGLLVLEKVVWGKVENQNQN
jgi:hypothetical protein